MENWQRLLSKAIEYKHNSEGLLDKAVHELMRSKGFSEKQVELFGACFAGGQETVVTFNRDGEMNDFGLENYCTMTKEEIIHYLKKFLSDKNKQLLIDDQD